MCQQNNFQTNAKTIYPEYSTQYNCYSQSWVSAISVFITKIIHTTVKVTCWNVTCTPLETATKNIVPWRSKISDISHVLCITAWCHTQYTIPLYCVFIIPLNWIYGVGQVERSHAWTFFTVCFVEWIQKKSNHWYSWHSQYEVWQYFLWICECIW